MGQLVGKSEWLEFPDKLMPERAYTGTSEELQRTLRGEGFGFEMGLAGEQADTLVLIVKAPETGEDIGYFVLGQEVAKIATAHLKGKTRVQAFEEFKESAYLMLKEARTNG